MTTRSGNEHSAVLGFMHRMPKTANDSVPFLQVVDTRTRGGALVDKAQVRQFRQTLLMGSKERGSDRGARLAARSLVAIGTDIRTARIGAGLSQSAVGKAVGLSYSQVGRVERGGHPNASVAQLSKICSVVGLDLSLRTFVGGPPLRDIAQVRLLGRFRSRLHPDLHLETEVPMPIQGDPRAWDGMLVGNGGRSGVEAVTRLNDLQALLRRIALKQRDAAISTVVLLLADTATNRAAVHEAETVIREAFPIGARLALASLAVGRHPDGSAVIFL